MNEQTKNQMQQIPPPNYLIWAILTTILCCLPFGIISIIYAAQVNSKWTAGDFDGAKNASRNAKIWAWVAFGVALVGAIVWTILALVIGVAGFGLDALEQLSA